MPAGQLLTQQTDPMDTSCGNETVETFRSAASTASTAETMPPPEVYAADSNPWVASGDTLSVEWTEEANESAAREEAPHTQPDGFPASSSMRRAAASLLGSKLRQGAGRFGAAAKNALVAETRALVKDAEELAVGIREGAQLTAQDTSHLTGKFVSTTKARVAASSGGLRGFLWRSSTRSSPTPTSESMPGPETASSTIESDEAGFTSPANSPTASPSPESALPQAGIEENPLKALSRGLTAQLGGTASLASPAQSPTEDSGSAGWAPDQTETGLASPHTPTDALERLLSGDVGSDSDDSEALDAPDKLQKEDYSTSMSNSQASTVAQRLKRLSSNVRSGSLKGLRQGLQAFGSPVGASACPASTPSAATAADVRNAEPSKCIDSDEEVFVDEACLVSHE